MPGNFGMTLYEMMWKAQAAQAQQAQVDEQEKYNRATQERSFLLRSQQQAQQEQTLNWEKERAENRFRDKLMADMDYKDRKSMADQEAKKMLEKGRMDRAGLEDEYHDGKLDIDRERVRLQGDGKAADLDLGYLEEEGRNNRSRLDRQAGIGRTNLRQDNSDRNFIQGRIDHWNGHPIQKRMMELSDAYDQIQSASGNGAGDLVALTKFMKLLDPGSTVRESEMINAKNITGFNGRVDSILRYIEGGGTVDPKVVQEIKAQSKDLVSATANGSYKRQRTAFRDQASRQGLDPDLVAPEDETDPYYQWLTPMQSSVGPTQPNVQRKPSPIGPTADLNAPPGMSAQDLLKRMRGQ